MEKNLLGFRILEKKVRSEISQNKFDNGFLFPSCLVTCFFYYFHIYVFLASLYEVRLGDIHVCMY